MNSHLVVLDLCGGTGAWSEPYQKAGYDVRIVTLPHFDVLTYCPPPNTHGVLAAPPCTMFSFARTKAKIPRDLRLGMETVQACLKIIWECRLQGNLKWWALENPVGYLRQLLGKPPLTFHPYEYGDRWSKRTDLWGYYTPPKKSPVVLTAEERYKCSQHLQFPIGDSVTRAKTPPNFAQAFFEANP